MPAAWRGSGRLLSFTIQRQRERPVPRIIKSSETITIAHPNITIYGQCRHWQNVARLLDERSAAARFRQRRASARGQSLKTRMVIDQWSDVVDAMTSGKLTPHRVDHRRHGRPRARRDDGRHHHANAEAGAQRQASVSRAGASSQTRYSAVDGDAAHARQRRAADCPRSRRARRRPAHGAASISRAARSAK